MTVYRGMDLGTAKPTWTERREVTYHLIDLVARARSSRWPRSRRRRASRERRVAARRVGALRRRHRAVRSCGTRQFRHSCAVPRTSLRVGSASGARAGGPVPPAWCPRSARRESNGRDHTRRIVRALEVALGSGRAFSSFGAGLRTYGPVRVVQVGLRCDLETLDERITSRFHSWLDEGLLEEVESLARTPGGLSRTARQAVGYRELLRHVEQGAPLESA